jgi:anthranilate/para-aminobenzoate synthase component II
VVRNDRVDFPAIEAMTITHIVISPGPGPSEAGASEDVIQRFAGRVLILSVCLDHQAIFEEYGGTVAVGRSCMGRPLRSTTMYSVSSARFQTSFLLSDTTPSCRNCRHHSFVSDCHSEDVEWTDHGCSSQVVSCRGGSSFIVRASFSSTATSSCTTLLSTTAPIV